jgi:hypothetical protein
MKLHYNNQAPINTDRIHILDLPVYGIAKITDSEYTPDIGKRVKRTSTSTYHFISGGLMSHTDNALYSMYTRNTYVETI